MKTIVLNDDFTVKNMVIPGIHDIPENAITVDDAVAIKLFNHPETKAYINGAVQNIVPAFNFTRAFNLKMREVVSAYKLAMSPIKANYTDEDIASFPTQEAEAKEWYADNNAATPLLDYMLASRPTVDKPTLVSRILQNSVIYKQIAGPAIGKKQHYEDLLYTLKAQHEDPEQPDVTQADIDAIVVDFSTS